MSAESQLVGTGPKRPGTVLHSFAFCLFLVLACFETWPLPVRLTSGLIGLEANQVPNSDVSIFLWNFWWVKKALVELHQSPIYCEWLRQPGPPVFVFPTLSLLNSLFALPLLAFASAETVYNILILLLLALTGWSLYLLVVEMTGSWFSAMLAGLLFGTTRLQVYHAGQINVFTLFWIPLALLAGRRLLATGSWKAALSLALVFLCNLLSDWYHAIDLGILFVALAAIKVWQARSQRVRRLEKTHWPWIAVWGLAYVIGGQFNVFFHFACLLSVVLYFLLLLHHSQESQRVQRMIRRLVGGAIGVAVFALPVAWPMYRSVQKEPWLRDVALPAKTVFSADLASYIMPGELVERLFPSDLPAIANIYGARARGAADVFPGYAAWAILLGAVGFRIRWGRRGNEWLLLSAIFLVLSLGPILKFGGIVEWNFNPAKRVLLPGVVFEFIGVLEGIRVFLRFAFPAYLCAAVFVGIQTADLLASIRGDRRRELLAIAGIVVTACLLFVERLNLPRPVSRIPEVSAYQWLRSQPSGTVLLCPVLRAQYMNLYSQTRHEKPMVNPYVSRRLEDMRDFVTSNPLLSFLERPLSEPSQLVVRSNPDLLKENWRAFGATWIAMDRFTYTPEQIVEIGRVLRNIMGLKIAYEDEHHIIYQEK